MITSPATTTGNFFSMEVALFKASTAGRSNGPELGETSVRVILF